MDLQKTMPDKTEKLMQDHEREKIDLKKDIQYNCQDLDQEQRVNVDPVQYNTQNVHLHIDNVNNYSCSITGVTYYNLIITKKVDIYLFFGHDSKIPVYKTISDDNGSYTIKDIPPGYYSLYAQFGANLKYKSSFIKILPGENIQHSVLLTSWYQNK